MTVIRQSKLQRDGLFGILLILLAVAMYRGEAGASSSGGRIAIAVIGGAIAVGLIWAWVRMITRPSLLEMSADAVTLVQPGGERRTLSRAAGNEIVVIVTGGGRYRRPALTIAGSGVVLPLGFFDLNTIQRQCQADGWQFTRQGRRRLA